MEPTPNTFKAKALAAGRNYTVSDVPPLITTILLGIQHYLTMLGATVLIPLILVPAMGGSPKQLADTICSIFFVSGINTFIQTTIGDRLPIVQGGSFAYLSVTFAIIFNPELQAITDNEERFEVTMRTLQGGFIVAGLIQMALGYTGLATCILKFITPVTIAPVIASIGLGLYGVGFSGVANCWTLGLTQMGTVIFFVLYLSKFNIFGIKFFALFPVILGIIVTWVFGYILTVNDVWEEGDVCRTDEQTDIFDEVAWIRIPYPGQWGPPIFKAYAIIPMWGAMLASMIESIGDYYGCANLSGAPPPTPGIISRGLGCEGIGTIIAGLIGTSNGTTSYSENIGALAVTGVGSRVVVQAGAIFMILVSCIGKFGAVFVLMPGSMTSGLYCVLFGMIIAVGLSNLQYVDLNSPRNQFIIGFALFNAMSVAGPGGWITNYDDNGNTNPFADVTDNANWAEILRAIFSSPMIIAFLSAILLDCTAPGTPDERGMTFWQSVDGSQVNINPEYVEVYALPGCLAKITRNFSYLEYISNGFKMPETPVNGYQSSGADITAYCCGRRSSPDSITDVDEEYVPGKASEKAIEQAPAKEVAPAEAAPEGIDMEMEA